MAARRHAKHFRLEAYEWLSIEGRERAEIEAVYAAFALPDVLRKLREVLAADLQQATIERAARAMSLSVRALQRRISECSTSFSDQLSQVCVLAAEAMLVQSSTKIEAIARDVGYRSVAAFTTMFGRIRGESPSSFRERYR